MFMSTKRDRVCVECRLYSNTTLFDDFAMTTTTSSFV